MSESISCWIEHNLFPGNPLSPNSTRKEKSLSQGQYTRAEKRLSKEVSDMDIIDITPQIVSKTGLLLESNPLRAMDAMHIACAIE